MEYIYILLLYLPSGFGRLTQWATGYQYTHAAVSLDDTYTCLLYTSPSPRDCS